jgi:hypothetical protein
MVAGKKPGDGKIIGGCCNADWGGHCLFYLNENFLNKDIGL